MSAWCLECVWGLRRYQDVAIPNPLAKFEIGHTRILPFLPVPYCIRMSMSWGVWIMSWGVCLVSGMCLRTEEVSGCSNTKSIGKIWIRPYSDIALSSSTLYCIKTSMSGGVWMVSEGVWMMSRWCLRVSGEASIPNLLGKNILGHDTQILPFLPVPGIA